MAFLRNTADQRRGAPEAPARPAPACATSRCSTPDRSPIARTPAGLGLPHLGSGRGGGRLEPRRVPGAADRSVTTDIHCVTSWSKLDTVWEGVAGLAPAGAAGRHAARPTHAVAHSEEGYTANVPLERAAGRRRAARLPLRRRGARAASTAGRCACSCRASTSGRAPSGSAAWSCWTTTRRASGSGSATRTAPTRGRRSATDSERGAPGARGAQDDFDQVERLTRLVGRGAGDRRSRPGSSCWRCCRSRGSASCLPLAGDRPGGRGGPRRRAAPPAAASRPAAEPRAPRPRRSDEPADRRRPDARGRGCCCVYIVFVISSRVMPTYDQARQFGKTYVGALNTGPGRPTPPCSPPAPQVRVDGAAAPLAGVLATTPPGRSAFRARPPRAARRGADRAGARPGRRERGRPGAPAQAR